MAIATKSVSSFAIFFVLFLVILETPEIEAKDKVCLKEYGGDVGFGFCAPRIYPPFCYTRCRENKGAEGGTCIWNQAYPTGAICLCDYCYDNYKSSAQILSGGI